MIISAIVGFTLQSNHLNRCGKKIFIKKNCFEVTSKTKIKGVTGHMSKLISIGLSALIVFSNSAIDVLNVATATTTFKPLHFFYEWTSKWIIHF